MLKNGPNGQAAQLPVETEQGQEQGKLLDLL